MAEGPENGVFRLLAIRHASSRFRTWSTSEKGRCRMRANDAAAETLQELADLVAISGGDQYRVRAYEKAARSVAGYPLDLDTLDRKALMEIPAVGGHIADKLLELGHTGRIAALEELYDQLRAGLRTLLGIPGLGPKRPTRSTWSLAFRRCRSCSPRCTTNGCA